jgi:hypothetical protein
MKALTSSFGTGDFHDCQVVLPVAAINKKNRTVESPRERVLLTYD